LSKIICSAAIRGAHTIYARAEQEWQQAMDRWGGNQDVGFPNTAYYLPIIYGILGMKVEKLADMEPVLKRCRDILPPPVSENVHLPYLAPALDAGMATFFAEEIIESIKYLKDPDVYVQSEDPTDDNLWLGAADDIILRKRGIEFVDGTAPGFAAIAGAAPSPEVAVKIAQELQEKNLYVFMCGEHNGVRFSEQLKEAGVQVGWPTRLVSFGSEISAAVFAMGFATRAAMSFGGIEPGDYRKILIYNKDRCFAFVMALGHVTEEWYANAAGAVNWGFPTIADSAIPEVLPTGICTYEHVVSNVPHDEIVARAVEVRGLKVTVADVPIPVSYGAAFEGERVRREDVYAEARGGVNVVCEWTTSRPMDEVEDGKVEVIGPDLNEMPAGSKFDMAVVAEVAGREMQEDFEPILERQIHHLVNYAQGIMHIGQRDISWYRIGKAAVDKGFLLADLGKIIHAKYHQEFGRIFDKVQVKIYTDKDKATEIMTQARAVYSVRDARIEGMTDETTDTYYSCTLCQSFAPSHVCVISPERTGLCGAYNWMDCRASNEVNPTGPNQPVPKGNFVDEKLGQFEGVNEFVRQASRGKIDHYNFYSIVNDPMTTCGCCECIAAVAPICNGVMIVNREYSGETPCGMKFTTLAGTIGGGISTPGFVGHSKYNICQRKFLSGDGGFQRLVWMPKMLKEEIHDRLVLRSEEIGIPDFYEKIADETIGVTEEEILPFLEEMGHPVLAMEEILA
jgi:acetyl-CoA synthase